VHYTILINPDAHNDIEQAYNYYYEQVNVQIAELFTMIYKKPIQLYKLIPSIK